MSARPDFFNVRKMAFILAFGPFAFLLSIALSDFSIHQFRVWQASGIWCTSQDALGNTLELYGSECR